jgi:phosphoribosyl-AMP cyclohydrolase
MNATIDESLRFTPRWNADGLITAVAVDAASGAVLMVAHMNTQALAATIATGEAHYWSRSRRELWHKGATSGAIQRVVEIRVDCDQDCLLLRVEPAGPACHTGRQSCFYRRLGNSGLEHVESETDA